MKVWIGGFAMLALAFAIGSPHPPSPEHKAVLDSDPRLDALFRRACANCHTNETVWPWYRFLVEHDVAKARGKLNLSSGPLLLSTERQEVADAVSDGAMPPLSYRLLHPEARLTVEDKKELAAWASKGH
jgi:hypothetical protein